ncbi:MAG TPA: carbohydrate binding family 9 domain-containing protein, partial [Longimicrobiales bacterium]|nr:carbohydrate binding family 9 domain-containing protein [Longimicrobiales bacterium]
MAPAVAAEAGQLRQEAESDDVAWPIDPATHPRPTASIARATGPVVVDGRPDEAAWSEAVPITRFVQAQPDQGHPATERTEVRLLYDDDGIYISCVCHDSHPDALTVTSLARDFPVGQNDALSFVFNPNPARRTGFMFSVNPDGAWWDGQTFDDMRVVNSVWDSPMEAAARRTPYGWSMEAGIPWTSLRFEGSPGTQEWGFNVLRRVRRLNEMAYWSPLQRHENLGKLSRAGTITGLEGLRQGRNLRIKPYVLGSLASGGGGLASDDDLDAGGDLK